MSAIPNDVTSAAPNDVTSAAPNDVTSAAPNDVTSAAPNDVTSAAPNDVTPAAPNDVTSAAPNDVTPAAPNDVTPAAPNDVTPAAPNDVTPAAPNNVASAAPNDVASAAPNDVTSDTNLVLVGRTGNGKSSTGNSILGERKFTPSGVSSSSSSLVYNIESGRSSVMGSPVVVVDGPGIGDTSTDLTDDGQSMISLAKQALYLVSNRFHALLVCLKYGTRFTQQEKEAMIMIKSIFGEDVIKNYGIIVMTCGDNFDMDVEDEGTTFEEWCHEQTGDIHDIFLECDNRCVLYNNKVRDVDKAKKQNEKLMAFVDDIKQKRAAYSEEDFKKAEPGQYLLLLKTRLPQLSLKFENLLADITKRFEYELAQDSDELEIILKELAEGKHDLEKEDRGSKFLDHLLIKFSILESRIKTAIEKQKLTKGSSEKRRHLKEEKIKQKRDCIESSEGLISKFVINILRILGIASTFILRFAIILLVHLMFLIKIRVLTRILITCVHIFVRLHRAGWMLLLPGRALKDGSVIKAMDHLEAYVNKFVCL